MAHRVGGGLRLRYRELILAWCLVTPALVLRLLTALHPFARTVYLSFLNYNLTSATSQFVGMGNYVRMAHDFIVSKSIQFTIFFVLTSTVAQIVLGLAVALILNANFRLRQVGRTVSLMPWAAATIAIAMVFQWQLDSQYGVVNYFLSKITGLRLTLVDPWGARSAVILTNVWKNAPFMALLFLAGLQGIPAELYDAAKVDGANPLQLFRHITLPLVRPLITTMAIFFLVWQLAAFDLIYGMTAGGPGFSTAVITYRIFLAAMGGMDFGYASALGVLLILCVSVVGVVGLIIWRRQQITV